MRITFQFRNETKGALRYEEIDDKGFPLKIEAGAKIGTLYVRKSAMPPGSVPARLTMEITGA